MHVLCLLFWIAVLAEDSISWGGDAGKWVEEEEKKKKVSHGLGPGADAVRLKTFAASRLGVSGGRGEGWEKKKKKKKAGGGALGTTGLRRVAIIRRRAAANNKSSNGKRNYIPQQCWGLHKKR
jgi:hypothetical protein